VAGPVDSLKRRLVDLAQVEFWASHEAVKEHTGPGDHLKQRFLDITQVALWAGQEAKIISQAPAKLSNIA
jgi:hypothetical protein